MPILPLLAACLLAATAAAADLTAIPADHRWLAQLEVAALQRGALAGALDTLAQRPEAAAYLAGFTAYTGADLRRDVERLTISGQDAREERGLFIASGAFDGARLDQVAATLPEHAVLKAGRHVIHRWKDGGRGVLIHGVQIDGRLVLISRGEERLRAALAVLEGKAPAATATVLGLPAMAPDRPLLLVAGAAGLAAWPGLPAQASALRQAQAVSASVAEAGGSLELVLAVQAADAGAARQLHDIAAGLVALARLDQKTPRDAAASALIANAQVALEGRQVKAQSSVPVAVLVDALLRLQPRPSGAGR